MVLKWIGSTLAFLLGVGLTVGLLLSPRLLPWPDISGKALDWPGIVVGAAIGGGALVLAAALWAGNTLIAKGRHWREKRVILGTALIAVIANTLYSVLVDLFLLKSGMRAAIAVAGLPVIYGGLASVLGKTGLMRAMMNILSGALMTMGAGFIIAALVRGW